MLAQAPAAIEVQRLSGSALSISNFGEHHATAIVFLSARSPESAAAAETIRKINNQYRRRRVMFVAVFPNPAESGDAIREFCQHAGFVFPCYRDPERKAAHRLGARLTPEAFVLDTAEAVVYSGNVSGLEAAVEDGAGGRPIRTSPAPSAGTPIGRSEPRRRIEDPSLPSASWTAH
jgi:hypothetical protein